VIYIMLFLLLMNPLVLAEDNKSCEKITIPGTGLGINDITNITNIERCNELAEDFLEEYSDDKKFCVEKIRDNDVTDNEANEAKRVTWIMSKDLVRQCKEDFYKLITPANVDFMETLINSLHSDLTFGEDKQDYPRGVRFVAAIAFCGKFHYYNSNQTTSHDPGEDDCNLNTMENKLRMVKSDILRNRTAVRIAVMLALDSVNSFKFSPKADLVELKKIQEFIDRIALIGNLDKKIHSEINKLLHQGNYEEFLKNNTQNSVFLERRTKGFRFDITRCPEKDISAQATRLIINGLCFHKEQLNKLADLTKAIECAKKFGEKYFPNNSFNANRVVNILAEKMSTEDFFEYLKVENIFTDKSKYAEDVYSHMNYVGHRLNILMKDLDTKAAESRYSNNKLSGFVTQMPDSDGNHLIVLANENFELVSANYAIKDDNNDKYHSGKILDDNAWSNKKIGNGLHHPKSISSDSIMGTKIAFRIPSDDLLIAGDKNYILNFKNKNTGVPKQLLLTFPQKENTKDSNLEKNIINKLASQKSPPYEVFKSDGHFKGLWLVGSGIQPCPNYFDAIKGQGYLPSGDVATVNVEDKLVELIEKDNIDYMIKSSHANGYNFATGVAFSCKKVNYRKFIKDDKEMNVLCQPDSCDEEINISYKKFLTSVKKKKTQMVEANLSCGSASKAAFEIAIAGSDKLIEIPTNRPVLLSAGRFNPKNINDFVETAVLRMFNNEWDYSSFYADAQKIDPATKKPYWNEYNLNLPNDHAWIEDLKKRIYQIDNAGDLSKLIILKELK